MKISKIKYEGEYFYAYKIGNTGRWMGKSCDTGLFLSTKVADYIELKKNKIFDVPTHAEVKSMLDTVNKFIGNYGVLTDSEAARGFIALLDDKVYPGIDLYGIGLTVNPNIVQPQYRKALVEIAMKSDVSDSLYQYRLYGPMEGSSFYSFSQIIHTSTDPSINIFGKIKNINALEHLDGKEPFKIKTHPLSFYRKDTIEKKAADFKKSFIDTYKKQQKGAQQALPFVAEEEGVEYDVNGKVEQVDYNEMLGVLLLTKGSWRDRIEAMMSTFGDYFDGDLNIDGQGVWYTEFDQGNLYVNLSDYFIAQNIHLHGFVISTDNAKRILNLLIDRLL